MLPNQETLKTVVRIITSDPATRRLEGALNHRAPVQIEVREIPSFFRWPQVDEVWSIFYQNGRWVLGSKIPQGQQDFAIEDLSPGETLLASEVMRTPSGGTVILDSDPRLPLPGDYKVSAIQADHSGWLLSDGRALAQTAYIDLFTNIGTTYNIGGEAAGQFRLPDWRGRSIVGPDNMGTSQGAANRIPNSSRVLGGGGGEERHTTTLGEIPAHSHGVNDPGHSHTPSAGFFLDSVGGAGANSIPAGTGVVPHGSTAGATTGISVQNAGGGAAHNNMQPYGIANVFIKI